jgi:hypothetical protein
LSNKYIPGPYKILILKWSPTKLDLGVQLSCKSEVQVPGGYQVRTKAGLEAAKARGRSGGRPGGMSPTAMKKAKSAKLLDDSGTKTGEIAKILGISRATCYRYIAYATKQG